MAASGIIVAAVDIGTNSVKLTVARHGDGRLDVLADTTKVTRLGKNVDAAGRLNEEAVARTLDALAEFARQARALGATRTAAVGTSALRDAANGAEFVVRAQQTLNGSVEIIAGAREAALIYAAAQNDPNLSLTAGRQSVATMDIGGGSTEFVLGENGAVVFSDSLQLGAVRLTERALFSDPPPPAEQARAAQIADEALGAVPVPAPPITVVGSGGTIANLAAMEQGLTTFTPGVLHGMRLTLDQIENRIAFLGARTVAQRRQTPGLEPDRADVILAGAIIQARALHRLGAPEIVVSVRGLRYGLLYELMSEH